MEKRKKKKNADRILGFSLNNQAYGVPLDVVEGVAPLPEVIPIPGCRSRVIIGLAYINGKVVTVLDIAPLRNAGTALKASKVVIVSHAGGFYALKIDVALDIVTGPIVKVKNDSSGIVIGSFITQKKQGLVIDIVECIKRYAVCK